MFDWWERRKARQREIAEQEERMVAALAKLEEKTDGLNGHEVETIGAEVATAAEAAVTILEPETANGTSG